MIETVEAIRREIVVDVGQARAFELFTANMTSWWPSAQDVRRPRRLDRDPRRVRRDPMKYVVLYESADDVAGRAPALG